MSSAHDAISSSLSEVKRLRRTLANKKMVQVRSADELDIVNANVSTWFRSRRDIVLKAVPEAELTEIDRIYREILGLTKKLSVRKTYLSRLKELGDVLTKLLTEKTVELMKVQTSASGDAPPAFKAITADPEMQRILINRWNECVGCVDNKLPLATIVMTGGLLEAVLIARINLLKDQSPVFTASAAPRDTHGKTLKLQDWSLSHYIDVAHELSWISETHKDIGVLLRDYRNYIHPYKELRHKKKIETDDARVLWEIGKTMLRQLLQVS